MPFPKHEFNRPVCLEAHQYLFHHSILLFHSSGFHHICNIKCRLDWRYTPQNIFNAKNFNPHKKPIVECANLHPGYAANLVARSRYCQCHWTLFRDEKPTFPVKSQRPDTFVGTLDTWKCYLICYDGTLYWILIRPLAVYFLRIISWPPHIKCTSSSGRICQITEKIYNVPSGSWSLFNITMPFIQEIIRRLKINLNNNLMNNWWWFWLSIDSGLHTNYTFPQKWSAYLVYNQCSW